MASAEAAGALRDALEAALAEHQRPSFKVWLEEQPITDDAAGDFIRDAKADGQLPDAIQSWEALQAYLQSRDVDAGVLTAAREVWNRYREAASREAISDSR
jgi:hypothetical protein